MGAFDLPIAGGWPGRSSGVRRIQDARDPRIPAGRSSSRPAQVLYPRKARHRQRSCNSLLLRLRSRTPSRDGLVCAAGPIRGHSLPRSPDMASDLRSPNGVRTRVFTLRGGVSCIPRRTVSSRVVLSCLLGGRVGSCRVLFALDFQPGMLPGQEMEKHRHAALTIFRCPLARAGGPTRAIDGSSRSSARVPRSERSVRSPAVATAHDRGTSRRVGRPRQQG
jgi:hypothetical protein